MNTTTNHVHNAYMRDKLELYYQLDKGLYGYAVIWPLKIQMSAMLDKTIDQLIMWGANEDGTIRTEADYE